MDSLTITLDPTEVLAKLEGVRLTTALKPFIKVASRVSADNIAREAKARLSRQLSGTSTGQTVEGIRVRADRSGWGWVVLSGNAREPMLPHWLERGTRKMRARPFFDSSARLEETAHRGRIDAAIHAGLSEYGLGDAG